jgi:hypothetical protein
MASYALGLMELTDRRAAVEISIDVMDSTQPRLIEGGVTRLLPCREYEYKMLRGIDWSANWNLNFVAMSRTIMSRRTLSRNEAVS